MPVHRIKYRTAGTMEQKGKHCAATENIFPGADDECVSEGLAPPHMTLTTTICDLDNHYLCNTEAFTGALGSHDKKSFLAVTQTVS